MTELAVENVQDYPRPPALEPVAQRLAVYLAGELVAETVRGVRILETHHAPTYYLPAEDVLAALEPVGGTSFCEWKGHARYFDVTVNGRTARRAAWTYPDPSAPFAALAGHVAFYAGKFDACFVGEQRVVPQPGDFYGGWVTPNLRGIPKGAPGTEFW
ncbi:hypothetical protein OCH239_00385 [Roseivivax halodurans JCM 10272]|uniref:DUF427 domain-containing protein n=1 Tax=Roseivivax halodurans JCM 10272 TaxID=1449350 RepID=X7EME0_9RHOB|nr:DUF427 domain-containing protein [Roseivivax halodurans]ETX16331.1 hypothetical protein OCH239_00385 [Roseivivax halodurans JCM 10272]